MGKHLDGYQSLIQPDTIKSTLSTFVVDVMEKMEMNHGNKHPGFRGAVFEYACLDMFLKEVGRGNLFTKHEMDARWPMASRRNIDLDISLVDTDAGAYIPFLLKTSLRERWKQCDRDIFLAGTCIEWSLLHPYIVFYREHPKQGRPDIEKVREMCKACETKCGAHVKCFNIYDTDTADGIFRSSIDRITRR